MPRFPARQQYDDAFDAEMRRATDVINDLPSLTKQEFTKDCDINEVVRRMKLGEIQLPEPLGPEFYGAVQDLVDLKTALNYTLEYQEYFDQMPAEMRAKFNNDPGEMFAFASKAKNYDEAVELGIFKRPPEAVQELKLQVPPHDLRGTEKTSPQVTEGDITTPAKTAGDKQTH